MLDWFASLFYASVRHCVRDVVCFLVQCSVLAPYVYACTQSSCSVTGTLLQRCVQVLQQYHLQYAYYVQGVGKRMYAVLTLHCVFVSLMLCTTITKTGGVEISPYNFMSKTGPVISMTFTYDPKLSFKAV
jgi:hypothetical protein